MTRKELLKLRDAELLLLAIIHGVARYEASTREVCVDGLRYSVRLDDAGLPRLYIMLANILADELVASGVLS